MSITVRFLAFLLLSSAACLLAAPTIGPIVISPNTVQVNTPTLITVTAVIADPSVLPDGINLLRLNANGQVLSTLGTLHDDGQNGDAVAGDKVFTVRMTFNDSTSGTVPMRISAAFKGMLQRVLSDTVSLTVSGVASSLPPDPATVAPAIDRSVSTTLLADSTAFLYTGTTPIQTGVDVSRMDRRTAAVLRGRVISRDGTALSGVRISVLKHPEYGQTLSRADGMYDLAVNDGGILIIDYQKTGYLSAQRQIALAWQQFSVLEDVGLIGYDTQVNHVNLASNFIFETARASALTDKDGARRATMLFPHGTTATMKLPDGSSRALTNMSFRATEYTVGPNGPATMPGTLPLTTAYTYAVEFSVDEAVTAGAKTIELSKPALHYVENFLHFPVGGIVPTGYYDRDRGVWVPSENGRVVQILGIVQGYAVLDVSGNGTPMSDADRNALGITSDEQMELARLYNAGQTLWRVPIHHFSPYDCNWPPIVPKRDARPPNLKPKRPRNRPIPEPRKRCGSVIECESQVLGESLDVTGTPFRLSYRSDDTPGRPGELVIPLSGPSLPASLVQIQLQVVIAGRKFLNTFPAVPNQETVFTWDGKDVYGRVLQGQQIASIKVGYVYEAIYGTPEDTEWAFAMFGAGGNGGGGGGGGGVVMPVARLTFTVWQAWNQEVGSWDARAQGLGGWTLSVNHAYDPVNRQLYLGYGERRALAADARLSAVIANVAGSYNSSPNLGDNGPATQARLIAPQGVAAAPDGSIYIADTAHNKIRKVDPNGIISTIAGTGVAGFSGDGAPAAQAQVTAPSLVALGPDNSLYFVDRGNARIRRITTDGIITTVAGNGFQSLSASYSDDGQPATQIPLGNLQAFTVDSSGALYFNHWNRVRRVPPNGLISTVAGVSSPGFSGDGGPAIQAQFNLINGLAVASDGSVFVLDYGNYRLRRIGLDGIVTTVAGTGTSGNGGDGGPALLAQFNVPSQIVSALDGSVYIADSGAHVVRRVIVGGTMTTIAGQAGGSCYYFEQGPCGDGGPAQSAAFFTLSQMAVGPDGVLYVTDTNNDRVRKVGPALPGLSLGDLAIASEDGRELYYFTGAGRHLRTLDALTGALLYQFAYDAAGRLNSVSDGDGNVTTVERTPTGNPSAVVGPYGQRNTLSVNSNGFLSTVSNPAGETVRLSSSESGLLLSLTDPKGNVHTFQHSTDGLLLKDADPAGGSLTLARTEQDNGHIVSVTTALNRKTIHSFEEFDTGDRRRVDTDAAGLNTVTNELASGRTTSQSPDGTQTTVMAGPDPRWGMMSPLISSSVVKLPSGLTRTATVTSAVTLTDPNNPLSLASRTDTVTVNGRVYTATYTASTRIWVVRTPAGRQLKASLDDKGRVVQRQFGNLFPVNYQYDSRGRLSQVSQGTGAEQRTSTFTYNSSGYLASITDPLARTVSFSYDAAGRVTSQTQPDGPAVAFSYDSSSNLSSLTPPDRQAHVFGYTPIDLTASYTAPAVSGGGTNQTVYTYDADRELTRLMRADNSAIGLNYDVAGRLSALTIPGGQYNAAYETATGNLASITAPDANTLSYTYDGSILSGTTWTGAVQGSVSKTYNADFQLGSIMVTGGDPVSYAYDRDGLATKAGDLTISRSNDTGLVTTTTLGTVVDTRVYNSFGELLSYRAQSTGRDLFVEANTRDNLGRITEKAETVLGVTTVYDYAYDVAGRLVQVRQGGLVTDTYAYDANGNRLSHNSTMAIYDAQDRLIQYGGTTYAYTPAGELSRQSSGAQSTSYNYDVLGNLKNVSLPSGDQITYAVDGQNRRVKKVSSAGVKSLLYHTDLQPIAGLDSTGQMSRFVYVGNRNVPDYVVKGGVQYRLITDHLGSVRLVVNAADGSIVQRIAYDIFGQVMIEQGAGFQPFGFAGGLYESDTGFVHFGARDYDSQVGRWTAKDPLGFPGGEVNLYSYVADPINFEDPAGTSSWFFGQIIKAFLNFYTVDYTSLVDTERPPTEIPTRPPASGPGGVGGPTPGGAVRAAITGAIKGLGSTCNFLFVFTDPRPILRSLDPCYSLSPDPLLCPNGIPTI